MSRLADGDLEVDVPNDRNGREIDAMSAALATFKGNAIEVRAYNEQESRRHETELAKADKVRAVAKSLEAAE